MTNHFDEQTTPQELESHINQYVSSPEAMVADPELPSKVEEAASHPNTPASALTKLYNHNMTHADNTQENFGQHTPLSSDMMQSLISNPNLSKEHAENFLKATSASTDYDNRFIKKQIFKRPDISNDVVHSYLKNRLDAGLSTWQLGPDTKDVHPDVAFKLYNEGDSNFHKEYALNVLKDTKKHTTESLDRVAKKISTDDNFKPDGEFINDLVENNQSILSRDNLNKIHDKFMSYADSDDWKDNEAIANIASHPQTDPALLAKMVNDDKYDSDVKVAAHANPSLPHEVLSSSIEKLPQSDGYNWEADGLLKNPNLTSDQVGDIAKKGYKKALEHEKAPQDLIRDHWSKTKKNTEDARKILNAKNLPTDILKELVNHKNQDVAIESLKHNNVDEDVLSTALKRRAKDVQEEAAKHPLIKDRAISDKIKKKEAKISTIATDKEFKAKFEAMSDSEKADIASHFHDKLKGSNIEDIASKSKEKRGDVITAKTFMATHPSIPENIKNEQSKDLVEMFKNNISATSEYRERRNDDETKSDIIRSVRSLLDEDNQQAKDMVLDHIPAMELFGKEISNHRNADFVKDIMKHAKEKEGTNIYDSYGHPKQFNPSVVYQYALKNENLSLDDLKRFSSDPAAANAFGSDTLKNIQKKLEESPERKSEIMDHLVSLDNKNINEEMLGLDMVEPKHLDKVFSSADHYDKERYLRYHGDNVTPALARKLLAVPEGRSDASNLKDAFLSNLKRPSAEIHDAIRNYLNDLHENGEYGEFKNTIRAIPSKLISGQDWENLERKMSISSSPYYAASLRLKLLKNHPNPKARIKELEQEEQSFAPDEQGKANNLAQFWDNMISQEEPYGDSQLRNIFKKGDLDYLESLPDSPEKTNIVNYLYGHKLFSDEKANEAILKYPDVFERNLSNITPVQRFNSINEVLTSPHMHPALVEKVIPHLNPTHLTPNHGKIDNENLKESAKNLANIVTSIDTSHGSNISHNVLQKLVATQGDFITETRQAKLLKSASDHILENATLPESKKFQILTNFSDILNRGTSEGYSKLDKFLKDSLSKTKDPNMLISAINSHSYSDDMKRSTSDRLGNMIQDPANLERANTSDLLGLIRSGYLNSDTKSIISNKAITEIFQAKSPEDQYKTAKQLAEALSGEFIYNYDEDLNASARLMHLADHPSPQIQNVAYKEMGRIISSSGIDSKTLQMYIKIPSNLDRGPIEFRGDGPDLLQKVNDPSFIEASTEGWKLRTLAGAGRQLNKNNAKILTNRALDSSDQAMKLDALNGLSKSVYVDDEDMIKLSRASTNEHLLSFIKNLQNNESTIFNTNAHHALNALSERLDHTMENPSSVVHNAQRLDAEHSTDLVSKIGDIANIFKTVKFDDESYKIAEKSEAYQNVLNKTLGHLNTVSSDILSKIEAGESDTILSNNAQLLGISLKNMARSPLKFDKKNHDQFVNAYIAHKKLMVFLPSSDFKSISTLEGFVNHSEGLKSQDWGKLFEKIPEARLVATSRPAIGTDISDNFSVDSFLKDFTSAPSAISQLFDNMDSESLDKNGKRILIESLSVFGNEGATPILESALKRMGDRISNSDFMNIRSSIPNFVQKLDEVAITHGAGGKDLVHSSLNKLLNAKESGEDVDDSLLMAICKSPHIDEKVVDSINKLTQGTRITKQCLTRLVKNPSASESILVKIAKDLNKDKNLDEYDTRDIQSAILESPNAPYSLIKESFDKAQPNFKSYFMASEKFNPALSNPKWGPTLMRDMPLSVPPSMPENVKKELLRPTTSEKSSEYYDKQNKIMNIMNSIPENGINWVEFKRQNPKLESSIPKEVKELFTANANRPITKEHLVPILKKLDEDFKSRQYHMTYSVWNEDSPLRGAQRHNGGSNLVVQLNLSEHTEKELKEDPKLFALYTHLVRAANGISGNTLNIHPQTPYITSWSRVDTGQGSEAWALEEIQSDSAQKFRRNARRIIEGMGAGSNINGEYITSKEMKDMLKKMDKIFDGWDRATINAVVENAKAHGIKKLYMHGLGIRSCMSGGDRNASYTKDYINPNIKRIYSEVPQQYGFQPCKYSDYPNFNKSHYADLKKRGLSDDCWVLDLEDKKNA